MPCGKPVDKSKSMKKVAKVMKQKPAKDGAMSRLSRGKY